jgi:hypothetical protein
LGLAIHGLILTDCLEKFLCRRLAQDVVRSRAKMERVGLRFGEAIWQAEREVARCCHRPVTR